MTDPAAAPTLGMVWGRRRQGKTYLDAQLACYSGTGFGPQLQEEASRRRLVPVDLDRLYHGS